MVRLSEKLAVDFPTIDRHVHTYLFDVAVLRKKRLLGIIDFKAKWGQTKKFISSFFFFFSYVVFAKR